MHPLLYFRLFAKIGTDRPDAGAPLAREKKKEKRNHIKDEGKRERGIFFRGSWNGGFAKIDSATGNFHSAFTTPQRGRLRDHYGVIAIRKL